MISLRNELLNIFEYIECAMVMIISELSVEFLDNTMNYGFYFI